MAVWLDKCETFIVWVDSSSAELGNRRLRADPMQLAWPWLGQITVEDDSIRPVGVDADDCGWCPAAWLGGSPLGLNTIANFERAAPKAVRRDGASNVRRREARNARNAGQSTRKCCSAGQPVDAVRHIAATALKTRCERLAAGLVERLEDSRLRKIYLSRYFWCLARRLWCLTRWVQTETHQ